MVSFDLALLIRLFISTLILAFRVNNLKLIHLNIIVLILGRSRYTFVLLGSGAILLRSLLGGQAMSRVVTIVLRRSLIFLLVSLRAKSARLRPSI